VGTMQGEGDKCAIA